jgi:hypothetical protein
MGLLGTDKPENGQGNGRNVLLPLPNARPTLGRGAARRSCDLPGMCDAGGSPARAATQGPLVAHSRHYIALDGASRRHITSRVAGVIHRQSLESGREPIRHG